MFQWVPDTNTYLEIFFQREKDIKKPRPFFVCYDIKKRYFNDSS